jgi:ATP-binding cassette, subfamily B, bacterial
VTVTVGGVAGRESTSERAAAWRLMYDSIRHQARWVVLGVVLGLLWSAARVIVPLLVRGAVDHGIEADDTDALLRWTALLGIVGVVQAICTGIRRYAAFRVARRAETDLRDRLFAHLQGLHFAYHDEAQTGQLMSRANTDLNQVQAFLVMIPLTMSNAATVLAVVVVLLSVDPVLTVLAVGTLPIVNVVAKRFGQRIHPEMMAIQAESAELAAVVEETVSGVRVVKGFGAEPMQRARFGTEADDVYDASMRATMVRARFWPILELLPNLGLIATLGYGGHRVLDGGMTIGTLIAFNVYVIMLIWPLRMLGMILAQAQRAVASAERVHEVLAAEPVVVDPPHPVPLPATGPGSTGAVRFEGVTFCYPGTRVAVLDGFDLEIAPGESVALVGGTGSGKSTVARLLPRFYDVEGGSVRLDGVDVRRLAVHDLRRAVGIVFEETFLFGDTVAANIAFADPDASADRIERAAHLAGAHDFVSELPDGYATVVGERGFSLSGGQRQRIAIARAILADPRVLVLDDATSAVDPTKEHEIRDALTEVMRGRTTIVIAHRPATIALADRVVLIDGGRVAADGTHAGLLATSEQYRAVLAAAAAHDREVAVEEVSS